MKCLIYVCCFNLDDETIDDESLGNDEDYNLMENLDGLDAEILEKDSEIIVPHVGMKFKHANEVFELYKKYAYNVGFPIRKRTLRKGEDGVVKYVTFSCCREGQRTRSKSTSLRP